MNNNNNNNDDEDNNENGNGWSLYSNGATYNGDTLLLKTTDMNGMNHNSHNILHEHPLPLSSETVTTTTSAIDNLEIITTAPTTNGGALHRRRQQQQQQQQLSATTSTTTTKTTTHKGGENKFWSGKRRRVRRRVRVRRRPQQFCALLVVAILMIILLIRQYYLYKHKNTTMNDNNNNHIPWLQQEYHDELPERIPPTMTTTTSSSSTTNQKVNKNYISIHDWKEPIIHIVNTRFMQEQGTYIELGLARYYLFITVCLSSMIHQSIQNFIWIIKIDPQLNSKLLQKLITIIKPYSNFYIIASNKNYLIINNNNNDTTNNNTTAATTSQQLPLSRLRQQPEKKQQQEDYPYYRHHPSTGIAWRDGGEGWDIIHSKIYTGNITKLYQAIALRNELPILETRLDADDGLHQNYLEYVQNIAKQRFHINKNKDHNKNEDHNNNKNNNGKGGTRTGDDDSVVGGQLNLLEGKQQQQQEQRYLSSNEEEPETGDVVVASSSSPPPTLQWLYWCSRRHLEWHIGVNGTSTNDDFPNGILNPVEHSKLCITPGMTVGYNVGTDPQTVPVHPHDTLYKSLVHSQDCYNQEPGGGDVLADAASSAASSNNNKKQKQSCLELVDKLLFCAIRSRTLTSAGMSHVILESKYIPKPELHDKLWQLAYHRFRFNETIAHTTKEYLLRHESSIAKDNLRGQCTTGHSCKVQAQQTLQAYVHS